MSRPRGLVKTSTVFQSVGTYEKNALTDKVIMHLNVLGSGVEDGVLRELDPVDVITVDGHQIRHLHP